jgi:hypothetical protein
MRRTDQRQQLAIKIKTCPQHADCLKWFVGAARIHRGEIGADGGGQTPVGIRDGDPSPMDAFNEAVADDLNQYRIRFEGADHDLTLRFDHPPSAFVLRWANALLRYSATRLATL